MSEPLGCSLMSGLSLTVGFALPLSEMMGRTTVSVMWMTAFWFMSTVTITPSTGRS